MVYSLWNHADYNQKPVILIWLEGISINYKPLTINFQSTMERLFKVSNVYRTQIDGRNPGEPARPKVEITLTYHETSFSSQNGLQVRYQSVNIALLDENANQCQLQPGMWVVASVSQNTFQSRTEQGRMLSTTFLDRIIPVDINQL